MDEYLKVLLEQIRCKKARPHICQEMKEHLEDQIAENMSSGMDRENAEKAAVKDMGDPVETGVLLDRIHRPQIAWKMLLMISILSVGGIIIHLLINNHIDSTETYVSGKYAIHVAIGFIVMMILYFVDYTVLARFSRLIAGGLLILCVLTLLFGIEFNGMRYGFAIGGSAISIQALMLLYVPIYGGIIYKYRGSGYKGLLKSIVWIILPVMLVWRISALVSACMMFISMLVMLTMAIQKGWYTVRKKRVNIGLWAAFIALLVVGVAGMYLGNVMAAYQKARIQAFLTDSGDANYLTATLKSFLSSNKMVGGNGADIANTLPGFNTDYILAYLSSTYGIFVSILVCCVLAVLICMIWGTALKQKNQLGMLMGSGCGMIFLISFVINVLVNLGAFPPTTTFLPFISAGGSYIVVSYGLLGIILSIYRYKNIYPRHVKTDLPRIKMTIEL